MTTRGFKYTRIMPVPRANRTLSYLLLRQTEGNFGTDLYESINICLRCKGLRVQKKISAED